MTTNSPQKYQSVKASLMKSLHLEEALLERFGKNPLAADDLSIYAEYTSQLSNLLNNELNQMHPNAGELPEDQILELQANLVGFEQLKVETQEAERFYAQKGNSSKVRLLKMGKRWLLKLDWLTIVATNLFRKEKKAKTYWKHVIEEAALADYVYLTLFYEQLLPFYEQLLQNREIRIRQLYVLDRELEKFRFLKGEAVNFEVTVAQVREDLKADQADIERFFATVEAEMDEEFEVHRKIAGTIEFPKAKLKIKRTKKLQQKVLHRLAQLSAGQQLVFFALGEHWRLKLHNRNLIFKLKQQAEAQGGALQQQLDQELKPAFIELKKQLTIFANRNAKEWEEAEKVQEIRSFVSQKVPELTQLVFQSKLDALFMRPMIELEQAIGAGPELHQFAAPVFDGKGITAKSFHPVQTRVLLQGSVLAPLKDEFATHQKDLMRLLQKLTTSLEEIKYAADYSVDFYFSHKQDEKAAEELTEGLKRTVKKSDEALGVLASMGQLTRESFAGMGQVFAELVLQYFEPHRLHQSEKNNQRRALIARRKAQAKEALDVSLKKMKHSFKWLKSFYAASYSRYFNLRNLLGISYEKAPISTELSNYLSETRQAIARLPLMYQKLFENVPLTEERFYLPRRAEVKRLEDAFSSWQTGRFSPVCIVGEQGSGTTTILNFFEKSIQNKLPVKRLAIRANLLDEKAMLSFFQKAFPALIFSSMDEFIRAIQENEEPQIVVLENIHKLFLRSSGDFGNLMQLFKLVSQTNSKLFWITSCYRYSWKLLDYTNSISGYFAYVIEFGDIPSDLLREAILKRHQLSGFSLKFLPPDHFVPKRNYQKMSEEEQQEVLKANFFEDLWQHAQSNLSLAFIYWLRGIREVEDGVITIQQKRLNFSFLNSLKTPEITSLHSILIHGGLGLDEHSRIFRCSKEESFRMLMVLTDDGLLEKQGEVYVVNPLVYRMLVSQLKSLNFIY